jgi:hypothetical protein
MANIDTLQAYEDLVASGITEKEAKAHAHLLNNSLDGLATKEDLQNSLQNLEKDLKYFFISSFIGFVYAPVIAGIIIAGILKWLGKF